jgi:hypothetical protein
MARGSGPREMSFPRESTEIFQLAQEHWTGIPAPRPEGKAAPRREPSRDGPAAQVATRRGVALEVGGADGVMCATRIDTAIAATLQERFSVKGVSWHPGQFLQRHRGGRSCVRRSPARIGQQSVE